MSGYQGYDVIVRIDPITCDEFHNGALSPSQSGTSILTLPIPLDLTGHYVLSAKTGYVIAIC